MSENLLMIFAKNPILGKVKTRIADTMGEEKALQVYIKLLEHTHEITKNVKVDKAIFYSDYVNEDDIFKKEEYKKIKQMGASLGDKMANAFKEAFDSDYKRVVIIGSDCLDLNENILTNAFKILEENEVVLGPAIDGGYYLLGMRSYYKHLFENKHWSTETVLIDTLHDLSRLNLSFKLLSTLSDIDKEIDLVNYPNFLEL